MVGLTSVRATDRGQGKGVMISVWGWVTMDRINLRVMAGGTNVLCSREGVRNIRR